MDLDVLRMGAQIKQFPIFIVRTCYREVCNHPFLVAMVLFVIYLYGSVPFVFSLLVSSSPVLICTAVLLGTLLSFGQPNIPEIEKEDKRAHDIACLKTGVSEDATAVLERDERCGVERVIVKGRDIVEKSNDEKSLTAKKISLVNRDDSSGDHLPLIDENSLEDQYENPVIEEVDRDYDNLGLVLREISDGVGNRGVHGNDEEDENQYVQVREVRLESHEEDHGKSEGEFVDDLAADRLDSSPGFWKHAEDHVEDHAESSDSESDRAESSSPDASMADILPMLDELHPLLDLETPQPAHDDLDAASQESHKSDDDGSDKLDEDTENNEEDGDDDDDEPQVGEDTAKSAITWTEDDQKNLMNLGTSEMERNQRLENLIARRRARKNMRMLAEKNLIDLEGNDLPFQIAQISTARRNPFDLPGDSIDELELLDIPGSAPSILLPRRNPFDLPYQLTEERPNLTADGFQQEFIPLHQKDSLFRRHESFSVGPSVLGAPRQLRPYFVPEKISPEGTSYPSFQRQSSEMSDSKLSSVPDTESMGSTVEQEDKKIPEQGFTEEAETITNMDHASIGVEHRSTSSEDVDSEENDQGERSKPEIELGVVEDHGEVESNLFDRLPYMQTSLSETGGMSMAMELDESLINLKAEDIEENYSSSSSSSPMSEESGDIIDGKEAAPGPGKGVFESGNLIQSALDDSDFEVSGAVIDGSNIRDPVYDSSPPTVRKLLSASSISSDVNVETSEMGSPPDSVKTSVPFADNESECKDSKKVTFGNGEKWVASSQLHAVDKTESSSEQQPHTQAHPNLSSQEAGLVENQSVDKEEISHFGQARTDPLTSVENTHVGVSRNGDALDSADSSFSEKSSLSEPGEQLPGIEIPMVEQSSDDHKEVQVPKADPEDKIVTNSSASTPGDTPIPFEDSGTKGFVNLKAEIVDGVDNDDQRQVLEDCHSAAEAIHSPSDTEHITEEADEIKDIDGGLLSELDTVSDFSVKETGSNMHENEGPLNVDMESLEVPCDAEIKSSDGVEETNNKVDGSAAATSLENDFDSKKISEDEIHKLVVDGSFHVEATPEHIEAENSDYESSHNKFNLAESKSELPVLEARSIEDIYLAFKRIHEGIDVEKSMLHSSSDNRLAVDESEISFEINSVLQGAEARNLEGTDMASKPCSAGELKQKSGSLDTRDGLAEVEVKEVVSSEEIDSTSKEKAVRTSNEKHNYGVEDPK